MLTLKAAYSATAIALTLFGFYPYIRSILRNQTKPHVFTWVIWGITTFVVFLAQIQSQAGIGAWPIGISGVITVGIAILAYRKRGDISITRLDWLFFCAALSSLPIWYLTTDPLWAVVILTVVDLLGFGPTLRKVYQQPHSESATFFAIFLARNCFVILALEHYSLTTVLFPAAIALVCLGLIVLIPYRKRRVP